MAFRKFTLDKSNAKFMGVCSGIAEYFDIDVTLVRIGAVVVTLLGAFPWTLVAYGVAILVAQAKGGDRTAAAIGAEPTRTSTAELRHNMRDIDRRMAEVEQYVTSSNSSLANEIEKLR